MPTNLIISNKVTLHENSSLTLSSHFEDLEKSFTRFWRHLATKQSELHWIYTPRDSALLSGLVAFGIGKGVRFQTGEEIKENATK